MSANEQMTWAKSIAWAIRDKDMEFPRPGQKDESGKVVYDSKTHDGLASFDLDLDTGMFPTINWLIAKYMLRSQSEYIMITQMAYYQGMVQRNINEAIGLLVDSGTPVYVVYETGGKNIACITLREWYKEEKEKHYRKIQKKVDAGSFRFGAKQSTAR